MLASQLIVTNYPTVTLTDKVSLALQLMEDYDIVHLAVVKDNKYMGLVAKSDLLDTDEDSSIAQLEHQWLGPSVLLTDHFLTALKLSATFDVSLVPVVNETKDLQGVIPQTELIHAASKFTGAEDPGGLIVLEMEKRNFSFSEISRLVETNDAYITQMNTGVDAASGLLLISIRINKFEVSDIVATFQRYDYVIRYYFGEESYENELKENYDLLMTYLKM